MKKNKFKETELGLIPEDWDIDVLSKHLYIKGRIGWKGLKKSEYLKDGSGLAIINGLQIQGNRLNWAECGRVPQWRYDESPEIQLQENDIVMTKDGTIGKVAFIDELPEPTSVASGIFVIREESNQINQKYLFYYFKSPIFKWLIDTRKEGSVVPHLYQRDFEVFPIAYPKLDEQKAIAKIFFDIDLKISLNQQMNKTLESVGRALFKRWFVDFEFPDENGNSYRSSGGEMVASELGEVPKGWNVLKLGDAVVVKGGTTPSTKVKEYWDDGKIFWCTPRDLSRLSSVVLLDTERKITEAGLRTISSGLLPSGTLLLSSRAPIGYVAISEVPVSINQGFIAIIPKDCICNLYMLFWIKNNLDLIKSMANGSTFQEISKSNFKQIEMIIPNVDIMKKYNVLVESIYKRMVVNEIEKNKLSEIRDSLLPRLMSGKIRVKCEDM